MKTRITIAFCWAWMQVLLGQAFAVTPTPVPIPTPSPTTTPTPAPTCSAPTVADLERARGLEDRLAELLDGYYATEIARLALQGRSTTSLRSARTAALSRHVSVSRGLQIQIENLLLEQAISNPPARDPYDPGTCGQGRFCPEVTIRCRTPQQIRDEIGGPAAAFCRGSRCELTLSNGMCSLFGLVDGSRADPARLEPRRLPTNSAEAVAMCQAVHEGSHALDDYRTCAACGTESIAYGKSVACMQAYFDRFCGQPRTWSSGECSVLQSNIRTHQTAQAFTDCLCSNRIAGRYDTYARGTCVACKRQTGASDNLVGLYCTGRELRR